MLRRTALAVLLLLCTTAAGGEKGIKIIVTNDVHGNVYGDEGGKRIGYAALRGYADALERDGWTVYLMDAGDAFSGNAVARFDSGKSVAGLVGKTGYRVLNPGNHAFDYNLPEDDDLYYQNVLLPAVRAAAPGPVDAVSVNVRRNGETPPGMRREPVILHEEDGLRVAVAGVTSPYTLSMSNRRGLRNYDFGLVTGADGEADHAATKEKILGLVADAAAPYGRPGDIVILLSHLGGDDSGDYAHGEVTGRDAAGVPNIDFVADSHSHNVIPAERVGEAYYGIAGRYMTNFEEITITRDGGAVDAVMETKNYDDLADVAPSEAILAETRAIADGLGMGDRVFELGDEVDLSDAGVAEVSTPLGRFICREMLAITGADFALFNAGGIRAGLAPGVVTVGDVYDMTPFQNNLQTFRLTGAEVYDLFGTLSPTANSFPQFFGITAYAYRDGENRYSVAGLLDADGEAIDRDAEYVFATISFLAEGGDGYSFPADELADDFGDFFSRFAEQLREDGGGDLEALNENTSLLLFDDREGAAAAWRGDSGELLFSDIAEAFRKHCVRVFIHGKTHDGAEPSVGSFGDDIRNERSTPVGGYWWDETHVIIHDPVLQDDFIRSVEISLPGSGALYPARVAALYPARVAARFTRMDAMLLEVLPGADGELPEAHPLVFVDGDADIGEAQTLSYGWHAGAWRLALDSGVGASFIADGGEETAALSAQGVLIGGGGEAIGLSFGDRLVLGVGAGAPLGEDTPAAPFVTAEAAAAAREDLRAKLAEAVLETTIRLRINVDDDDSGDGSLRIADELIADGSAEVRAPGLVVGGRNLLVPVALPHGGIARIDDIRVTTADGRVIPARFLGAFRKYMALLIEVDEDLPTENLPGGFALLNPLLRQNFSGGAAPSPEGELIQRWRIDYALGRRREIADYDRWAGTFRGYRGDVVVQTRTDEDDASLAFDGEGRLAALSLAPRLMGTEESRLMTAPPGFRPVDFLSRQLRADDAFDPSLRPVDEEQGERLIDLGVEFQPLDPNTARLFHAARETRAGEIGLLVTHVYPGTIAGSIGLREHDVLVRMIIEGRPEPVELRSGDDLFGGGGYEADMSSEMFRQVVRFMPPPWPGRDNAVSALLTGLGAGRKATVEFLREGTARRADFTTRFFEPDYRGAPKTKFGLLGLTAKPVTYEVARFFNRPAGRGVVVSRVEEGGKAAVAGLHHYLVITHVDGREVEGMDDFAARVRTFETGAAASVELTVDSFGKTRLVKIE